MKIIKMTMALCLIIAFVAIQPNEANAQCKKKFSIDYVGMYSEYYTACNSEMKTTFDYEVEAVGAYTQIWAQVENTPYSEIYVGDILCPEPPCEGSVIEWNHCETLQNHRMIMDVLTPGSECIGFTSWKLTAEYFADGPG